MQVSGWWLGMAMWHVFPSTHTHQRVVVWRWAKPQWLWLCVDDVMGCACHHTHTTQDVRAATKAHAIHTMCVCEAEEWAVDEHSGLVVVVVVGEEGWRGGWWWQKHRKG